jgi:transcriptional regulator with XRE-family HTH domain
MLNIRDILAHNLKVNRQKCRLSQAKLAEKANITTQYIAMIEVSRKFPTPEMLERLAKALNVETYELFTVENAGNNNFDQLRKDVIEEVKSINESIASMEKNILDNLVNKRGGKRKKKKG